MRSRPGPDRRPTRWDLWLPAASLAVAAALLTLAGTAATALRERHALAVDGRLSQIAHSLEVELREAGPKAIREVLSRELASAPGFLRGLSLAEPSGAPEAVGDIADPVREVDLFLGPAFREAGLRHGPGLGPGHGGGRRTLALALDPNALAPPRIARLLTPVAAAAGTILVGLAVLGGRLLVRQTEQARREGDRRRLEGLARAGAGLAHQLRTPLATIKGSSQLLLEAAPVDAGRRLEVILEQAGRMDRLLGQLLDYARPPEPESRDLAIGEVLAEAAGSDPRLEVHTGPDLAVRADPEHLAEILANLVANALAASSQGGCVELAAAPCGDRVEITVSDRGPGPGADAEHLFEPYVTGRADGTGLGLPIARSLAVANGGELTLLPRLGGGTVARLLLPRAAAAR